MSLAIYPVAYSILSIVLQACIFLVDTGAEVSAVPPTRIQHGRQPDGFSLQAANNTVISTYGNQSLTLDFGPCRTFRWVFVIADIKTPILGADFLQRYGLLVDVGHNRLVYATTHLSVHGIASSQPSLNLTMLPAKASPEFQLLLSEFPGITQPSDYEQPVKHNVTNHIATTRPPVHACVRRLCLTRV